MFEANQGFSAMAPLELEGTTLGEKHRHYNKLVKEAIIQYKGLNVDDDLNTGEKDVKNLLKIDVACSRRDVDYIIKVLKCEDMLYVSRAIKQCKWLVTDPQYSHIINPYYLHDELFPQMTTKATNKLLLHARLNLKDEARVEDFYNYLKEKDIKIALKWLPHCSLSFIEQEVSEHGEEITKGLLKRLCEISISVLEKWIPVTPVSDKENKLKAAMFLINNYTERYLDIFEKLKPYEMPTFGPKYTDKIMKVCPDRIKSKFVKYAHKIDTKTFAKHMEKEELKDFLKKQSENKDLCRWFTYNNMKHFVSYLPREDRLEFLKNVFIGRKRERGDDNMLPYSESDIIIATQRAMMKCDDYEPLTSNANIYRWYNFSSFDVAFPDLIKLIRAESNPDERIAMFGVLLSCAGRNAQHVHTLLQYYHDNHINEQFRFKIQFVNKVLSKTSTHKFDEKTWNILNNIFRSMGAYSFQSNNNVQSCIEAIIVYRLLHTQSLPIIVVRKFSFSSLKSISKKLNVDEGIRVFNFLYKFIVTKIEKLDLDRESDFSEAAYLLVVMEPLLSDWKKDFTDYPWIHKKIKELIESKKKNSWNTNLSYLYNINKAWRREMFRESILMSPSEETCYNALKHDPALLTLHASEVEALRNNDELSLRKLLQALRVYWPSSLAADWTAAYLAQLDKAGRHKAVTLGLCYLSPLPKVLDLVKKYAPTDSIINWSEEDEVVLSLRKHFARNMHVSRPQPPPEIVLLYAKGDYLQFALPSVNAVLFNLSPDHTREHIAQVLDSPVSLQKHGIRIAFQKFKSDKLKKLFFDIWMTTKNASIRAVIFRQTFLQMRKDTKSVVIEDVWSLLSTFIDNLSSEENKVIYDTLGKVDKVPLIVKGKFFMKSYKCLKALPAKANCEGIVNDLEYKIKDIIQHLDPEFVAELISSTIDKQFITDQYNRTEMLAAYLLCAKDEQSQMERFTKVLLPVLDRSFALWDLKVNYRYCVSTNVDCLLAGLNIYFQRFVFDLEMTFPTKLFTEILNHLEKRLSIESNYVMIRSWKLLTTYVKFLEEHKDFIRPVNESCTPKDKSDSYHPSLESKWNEIYRKAIPKFTEKIVHYLKEDVDKYFPTITVPFGDALSICFNYVNKLVYLNCLLSILKHDKNVYTYLMVLRLVPGYINDPDNEKGKVDEIREILFSHPSTEVKFHYHRKYGRHDL